jgi:hypothetical protein
MTMHNTLVEFANTSATEPLILFTQSRVREPAGKPEPFWSEDPAKQWLNGRSQERVSWLTERRRMVLVANGDADVFVNATHRLLLDELTLDEDGEWGPDQDDLTPLSPGSVQILKLTPNRRYAVTLDPQDEVNELTIYLRNGSDTPVQLVRREFAYRAAKKPAAQWDKPVDAALVAPGCTATLMLTDDVRAVVKTTSRKPVCLDVCNRNMLHSMRLAAIAKDGNIEAYRLIGPASGPEGISSGFVDIDSEISAVVEQAPV